MKFIRFLALLLCAALLLPLVPVHAAQSGGSFYLTASTAGQTLIEPVAVPYTAGQTIRDALRGSGYAFGGIDTAFITDIEGVAGNFTVYYDGGAYSLDAIASPETVTAVVFSESGITASDDILSVLVTTDAEQTKAAIDSFSKTFQAAVEAAVKERLRGEPPRRGSGGGATPMTKEQIMKIRDPELRQKKMLENKELFNF